MFLDPAALSQFILEQLIFRLCFSPLSFQSLCEDAYSHQEISISLQAILGDVMAAGLERRDRPISALQSAKFSP